jgi:hypothetical protein
MRELASRAPRGGPYRVYLLGGGTAVLCGWRDSTIDADLFSEQEEVFRDIQRIKNDLQLNVELVRPEHFVPALEGSESRHLFVESIGEVSFYHYDPCAQLFSKVVRGFRRDLLDARSMLSTGMVDAELFRELVERIPDSAYSKYPSLSKEAVIQAVESLLRHQ